MGQGPQALNRALFPALALFSLTSYCSPPLALLLGVALALLAHDAIPPEAKSWTKPLLQASVVGLGFGMDLRQVLLAGSTGLVYTAGGIALTLLLGSAFGRLLNVERTISYLISTGTAICGGSAIAAVGPVLGANAEEMSVSLGVVFLLNSAALLIFPPIGASLGMSQPQFGLWAALAIHDTSSVVGAAVKYGAGAVGVATTVKLARALWIVPVTVGTATLRRSKAKTQWPWFIGLFVLAAAARSATPGLAPTYGFLYAAARAALKTTLFLIGCGLSRSALAKVGARPLVQAVALWVIVAAASAALILAGVIR